MARVVSFAWLLNFNNGCTHVAQHHRAVRPGQDLGQVEHADVGEGQVGRRHAAMIRRVPGYEAPASRQASSVGAR